ncbi:MAG: hypothetical protein GC192_09615 [Bacteroidetes bacterium]|nr:hypothetical protein [Bacteroidota bacterium]
MKTIINPLSIHWQSKASPSVAAPFFLNAKSILNHTLNWKIEIGFVALFVLFLLPSVSFAQNYELAEKKYEAARRFFKHKDYQHALEELEAGIALGKASTYNLDLKAKIYLKMGKTTEALSAIYGALNLAEQWYDKRDANTTAALIFATLGDTMKVLKHLNLSYDSDQNISSFANITELKGYWNHPRFSALNQLRRMYLAEVIFGSLSFSYMDGKLLIPDCQNYPVDLNQDFQIPVPQSVTKEKRIKEITIVKNKTLNDRISFSKGGRLLNKWYNNPKGKNLDSVTWDASGKLVSRRFFSWNEGYDDSEFSMQCEYAKDGSLSKMEFIQPDSTGLKTWGTFKFEAVENEPHLKQFDWTSLNEPYSCHGYYEFNGSCQLTHVWYEFEQDTFEMVWDYQADNLSYIRLKRFNSKVYEDEIKKFDDKGRLAFNQDMYGATYYTYNKKGQLTKREVNSIFNKFNNIYTIAKMKYNKEGLLKKVITTQPKFPNWKNLEIYHYSHYVD